MGLRVSGVSIPDYLGVTARDPTSAKSVTFYSKVGRVLRLRSKSLATVLHDWSLRNKL